MKAVMLSVRPQWCELIANGRKTIEVRKTRPKMNTPFKCYIYCTVNGCSKSERDRNIFTDRRGKVIGEFVCDGIHPIFFMYGGIKEDLELALDGSCLSNEAAREYFKTKGNKAKDPCLYGWHISALQIYDKPKEPGEFKQCGKCPYGPIERCREHEFSCDGTYAVARPFQSWGYVEELE